MSKERYNQIIDEAYENYHQTTLFSSDPTYLKPIPGFNTKTGKETIGARQYMKEEFINKCKTDPEFSEKWGLKIEERELSLEERIVIKNSKNIFISKGYIDDNGHLNDIGRLKLDKLIPTKLITLTYNNETIESYE